MSHPDESLALVMGWKGQMEMIMVHIDCIEECILPGW